MSEAVKPSHRTGLLRACSIAMLLEAVIGLFWAWLIVGGLGPERYGDGERSGLLVSVVAELIAALPAIAVFAAGIFLLISAGRIHEAYAVRAAVASHVPLLVVSVWLFQPILIASCTAVLLYAGVTWVRYGSRRNSRETPA